MRWVKIDPRDDVLSMAVFSAVLDGCGDEVFEKLWVYERQRWGYPLLGGEEMGYFIDKEEVLMLQKMPWEFLDSINDRDTCIDYDPNTYISVFN